MALTRLKQLREEAVLTVHELAEASGVSDDTISKIENGQRVARPNTLRKLAHALDVSPQELRRPAKTEELASAGKAEAPRGAGQLDHDHAVLLRDLLDNARKVAQPIIEQDDQTIAAYRQALARMKGGIGVSDAYFVEESPEQRELGAEAEVVDLLLEREERKRKMARSG